MKIQGKHWLNLPYFNSLVASDVKIEHDFKDAAVWGSQETIILEN